MFWNFIRRRGVVPLVLIIAALSYWKLHPRPPRSIGVGYIGERSVMLWNTLAQVRQPVAELHYGDRVEVVKEEGTSVQLRTASGTTGWLQDSRELMDSDLWAQSASLLARARTLPVQARGQTKTVSNVRAEPGRDGKRIFQLPRGAQVIVLGHTLADAPQTTETNTADDKGAGSDQQKPKQEDWLLVLSAGGTPLAGASSAPENSAAPVGRASGDPVSGTRDVPSGSIDGGSPSGPIAGWVLARFIELDLPGPVKDYASSADLHVLAWFELNRVPDGSGGDAPQYLVAGSRGGEGQACDFTMLRVYTWGIARKRYETAYVESDLCGRLPIQVSRTAAGPEFHFAEAGDSAAVRTYVMRQTSVRRVKDTSDKASTLGGKSRR